MLLSAMGGLMIFTPSVDAEQGTCRDVITFIKAPGANPEEMGVFQPVQVSWHADPGNDTGFTSIDLAKKNLIGGKYEPTNHIKFDNFDEDRNPVWTSNLTQIVDKNTLLFNYDKYSPGAESQNIQDIYDTRLNNIEFQVKNYYTAQKSVNVKFVIYPRGDTVHTSVAVQIPAGTSTQQDTDCNGADTVEEPGEENISIPSGIPQQPFQFKAGDKKIVAELVISDSGDVQDKITLNIDVKNSVRTKDNPYKILIRPMVFRKDFKENNKIHSIY